jgi:hypothetical protein
VYPSYYNTPFREEWRLSSETRVLDVDSVRARSHAQELRVCVGDDVASNYEVAPGEGVEMAYCNVRRLTLLTFDGTTRLWVWPRWYKLSRVDRNETDIERRAREAYRHLGAPHVYLDPLENHDPFPATDFVSQVMAVHACVRGKFSDSGLPMREGLAPGNCGLRPTCHEHDRADCATCPNGELNVTLRDKHDFTNNSFIILTTALGFHPSYRKAMK